MTNRDHKLSLTRQADLLGISRGSLYYEPRPTSDDDLKLMRRIDELHMEYPFAGSRMMKGLLRQEGFTTGRLHLATCMKRMGIQALYRRPNTSKPAPGHKVFPYLLRKLAVTRPNQVWAMPCRGRFRLGAGSYHKLILTYLFHLYSPVSKICAHPRGEMCARSSGEQSSPSRFRALIAWPRCFVFQ